MRCTCKQWIGVAILVVSWFSGVASAQAPPAADDLQVALARLEQFLGSGPNAQAWRTYLDVDQLQAELTKGLQADPAVLARCWRKFSGDAPGLELPPFVAVREALAEKWRALVAPSADKLPEAIKNASYLFVPFTPKSVEQAGQKLAAALKKLHAFLQPGGANGAAWEKYLLFDEVQKQLALPISEQDPLVLKNSELRFFSDRVGLELPAFREAGKALRQYRQVLMAATEPELEKQFTAQLDALAADLAAYQKDPDEKHALAVNDHLGWLAEHHQAALLLLVVRHFESQPNLFVQMSAPLLALGFDRNINEPTVVQDNILGTAISGNGRTVGKIGLRLIPDERQADFELYLTGVTTTQTVGYNGPAVIQSRGTTTLSGTDRVELDATGLRWFAPLAQARTATQIMGISAGRGGIAQNIATDRVYESKPQAEVIAGQHAAARLRARMAAEIGANLAKANQRFQDDFRNPLVRAGGFPDELHFSTTADALFIKGLEANVRQLGAPGAPPGKAEGTALLLQLHESSINNLLASVLSGKTLRDEDVRAAVLRLRGSLPEELKNDEDREPWSITFADKEPVVVSVGDGEYRITIRGKHYTSGERSFKAMNVGATYKIARDGNGSKMTRQGDLQIFPPDFVEGKTKFSMQETALRSILRRKFGKLFPPESTSPGLELPGRWKAAGRLPLRELVVKDGWFALGWGMPGTGGAPATAEEPTAAASQSLPAPPAAAAR